jgi:hypothetical protein
MITLIVKRIHSSGMGGYVSQTHLNCHKGYTPDEYNEECSLMKCWYFS